METPNRRRPPPRPPGEPPPARPRTPRWAARGPVTTIASVGALVVVVVVVVAFATGTADDLPWGAIIGVVVVLGAMVLTARRRERMLRDAFPEDDG
ncbi:LPXTG cell wall anchor domain-containing protein [Miltoncostaea oceani]|uniref:LPXTG cell wall anchor domain-containing protein n=1 Tax=Miltoncostaea oceani TaxID=2843216 RepID=UPI001C3E34E0|nr:LPXTG cell wall anchor domain-containing protein [Miltoncostaea oceani]